MQSRLPALATGAAIAALAVAAAPARAAGRIDVGVLLPETTTSVRWATQDAPALRSQMRRVGLRATVVNAHGSTARQYRQALEALRAGAKVLVVAGVADANGDADRATRRIVAAAHRRGARVVDYDRFTPGGPSDYYVSYDNAAVGLLQGAGLIRCLAAAGVEHPVIAQLDGAPVFVQGYEAELGPHYASGQFVRGPARYVPRWSAARARSIFAGMLRRTHGAIDAVVAGNDALAGAAIGVLRARHLPRIPIAGQDATVQGLRHLLSGEQCVTVQKSARAEAREAARVAARYVAGRAVTSATAYADGPHGLSVPATLLAPAAITVADIGRVFAAGDLRRSQVCTGSYASLCRRAGV